MVADAVIYHPTITHYLKFVGTTVGRDKLLRTLQYFARFYAWYLLRTNATKTAIQPWETMKKQFGLVRKVLRAGKNVEHFKAAALAADNKTMDPVLRYTAVGRQLGYAGYLSMDLLTLLDATGIKKSPNAKRLQQEAYRFWAAGITFSIVGQLYTLWQLKKREEKVDRKEGEGVVEGKRIAKYVFEKGWMDDEDDDDDDDEEEEEDEVDGIYLGSNPPPQKGKQKQSQPIPEEEEKDPFAISDDSDDDAEMEAIRRKILASKPFTEKEDTLEKKPEVISRPTPHSQNMKPDSDAEPDSDNGSDNDDFDDIIDATPMTDRIGLSKLEKERARVQTTSRTFSSGGANAPNRW